MNSLYIYNCGEIYPVNESSFCLKNWEVSLIAQEMVLNFNLLTDYPHVVNLCLAFDILCQKSTPYLDHEQFWQEVSPINKCWYEWNKHNEMN